MRRSRLYLKAKITKSDGTALTNLEKTGIINLPLQFLFSQIDVYMNGKCVTQNANNYPWKAFLKVLLSNGTEASESHLQTQLYYPYKDDMDDAFAAAGKKYGSSDTLRLYATVPHLRFRSTPVLGLFLSGQEPH